MFLPIKDTNPLREIPLQYVTIGLIALNVLLFLWTAVLPDHVFAASFAVVPVEFFADVGIISSSFDQIYDQAGIPEFATLITYQFLHGDVLHLVGNMLFLWVFGDNVEDALGHVRFLVFYLACGIVGGLAHLAMTEQPGVPLIGASGAISGVVAAYLLLHPKVNLWVLVLRVIPLQVKALWALGAWIAMQFVMVLTPSIGPTAWWSHVGGLVAGAVLVVLMRRPGVKLFDQETPLSS